MGLVAALVAAVGTDGGRAWAPLLGVLGVAASTLVHEGAHALAAHGLGYRVEWVVLGGLSGVTAYEGRDDRPLDRAAVALAGPAATAALLLVLAGVHAGIPPASPAAAVVELLAWVNGIALALNLLPVGGSDGAQLVRGLWQHRRGARPSPRRLAHVPDGTDTAPGAHGGAAPTLAGDVPR